MFVHDVIQTIRRHNLFRPGQHILVGVSGGADSIALLALLRELAPAWKLRLTAAHLNHRIRGADADADARFVRSFARRLGVGFIEGRKDIPRLARRTGVSLEMAGREARYAFFADAARRRHCDAVATAHTADDQAETILIKLARGAGAQGLAGIPYIMRRGSLAITRPLRDVSRAAILQFLRRHGLAWREDATNAQSAYLRNRVRHEVLPFLESKLNPRIRQALGRMAEILDKENEWLDGLARMILSECAAAMPANTLDGRILAARPQAARRRVLRLWLVQSGLAPETLDFDTVDRLDHMLTARQGRRAVNLPGGRIVRKQRDILVLGTQGTWGKYALSPRQSGAATVVATALSRRESFIGDRVPMIGHGSIAGLSRRINSIPDAFRVPLKVPGETLLPQFGLRILVSLAPGIHREKPPGIGRYPARASLALAAWRRRRIFARSRQPGDRFSPLGLAGSKKVQDIFTDEKIPRDLRQCVPLLECGGKIVWIPGYRIAQGWEIKSTATKALQLVIDRIKGGIR